MGSCARLRNGPAHRPHASFHSEPRSCDLAFSFILPASPCALTLFVLGSLSSFPYSECPPHNATCHHPMPPAFFHLFHPPPRFPQRHRCSQRACRQTCPTAATSATLLPCSIAPHVFPSPLSPSSCRVSVLPRCQHHQYPPRRHCLAMQTKDIKPLEN